MKKVYIMDEKSDTIKDILDDLNDFIEEKNYLKKLSEIICKIAVCTITSLAIVLGFFTVVPMVLTGTAIGLMLAPIYTVDAMINNYNEYRDDSNNEDVLENCAKKLKEDLKNTMDVVNETYEYITSYRSNQKARNETKKIMTEKLENAKQKGMDKRI